MVATWLGIAIGAALTLAVMLSRFAIAAIFLGESTDAAAELSATLLLVGSTGFRSGPRSMPRFCSCDFGSWRASWSSNDGPGNHTGC
jgi:hypothetical protein